MRAFAIGLVGLCACAAAQAQYATGFEPPTYAGSAAGTPLTNGFGGPVGQDNWYNPVASSVDFNVHTYAGNAPGFPVNPNGGTQFASATGGAAPLNIGRGQHANNFSAGGTWTIEWDVIGKFAGTAAPALNNLGSFSLQPSATANYWQQLMAYGDVNTTTQYNINYSQFTAAGGGAPVFASAGPAWVNVPVDHWIHQSTTWDFTSNQILSVTIQDITAGTPAVTQDVSGLGWYLFGGANNVGLRPAPTDIRIFTGQTNNVTGWDNITVVPAPASLALLGLSGLVAGRRRR